MHERSLTLTQFTRKYISKFLAIADQFQFFPYFGKVFDIISCNFIFRYLQLIGPLCDNQSVF